MLLEAETNKYCPGEYDFGAISNLITWVLNFFLSAVLKVHKIENFFDSDFGICIISLLVMSKY
jgi:hypothetical protein